MSSVLCCDEKCVYQDAEWDPNTPGSYPIIGATKAEGENMVALCNEKTKKCVFFEGTTCTDYTSEFDTNKCYPLFGAVRDHDQRLSILQNARSYTSTDCTGEYDRATLGHNPKPYFSTEISGICSTLFNTPDCTGPVISSNEWSTRGEDGESLNVSMKVDGACRKV